MATVPIEVRISTEQLLQAVEQLPPEDLSAFVEQVLVLRAQRNGPRLGEVEAGLLLQINQGIPAEQQRRFAVLVARRQDGLITPDELHELKNLAEQIEQQDVQRLAALDELARLRGVSLRELMVTLGIQPPPYG